MSSPYEIGSPWPHFRGNMNYSGASQFYGPSSNITQWILTNDNYVVTSMAVSADGNIYLASYSYSGYMFLSSISPRGDVQWFNKFGQGGTAAYSSPAIAYDGSIVLAGGGIYSIDTAGSTKWTFDANTTTTYNIFTASPSIMPGTLDIIIGTQNGYMMSISSMGSLKWSFSCFTQPSYIYAAAAIGLDGSIYFGSSDYNIYKLSMLGSLLWWVQTGGAIRTTPAIGKYNSIYSGSCDGYFYNVLVSTGSIVWKFKAIDMITQSAAISPISGDIYFPADYILYALSPKGSMHWSYAHSGQYFSGSPVVDSKGIIFIAVSLTLLGLSPNGTIVWQYSLTNEAGFQSSPTIGFDGTLYIGSSYSHVYGFGLPKIPTSLTEKALWPLYVGITFGALIFLISVALLIKYSPFELKFPSRYESGDYVLLDDENGEKSTVDNEIQSSSGSAPPVVFSPKTIRVPKIRWNDISIPSKGREAVVGQGSFGVVVKALWTPPPLQMFEHISQKDRIVAIKVLTRSVPGSVGNRMMNHEKVFRSAINELQMMKAAEERMTYKDCIVKVHGLASGKLTRSLCVALNLNEGPEAIGIVMRFEGGGSLNGLIYERDSSRQYWPLEDKLRVLTAVARGLAELHAVGVVHGDVKPDNVLLSDDNPPEVRLADFGLSTIKAESTLGLSSLSQTKHMRGSPIYCAPEILHNPFISIDPTRQSEPRMVAKPSRKTDVYAFALVTWEVLTEQTPFSEAENETHLSTMVHRGDRPALELIPIECPQPVVSMIEACWKADRKERHTALECYSILSQFYNSMISSHYDVYLSHDKNYLPSLTYAIYHRLTQQGFRIWFDNGTTSSSVDDDSNAVDPLFRSNVFVMIAGESYQRSAECMAHLSAARYTTPPKRLVLFFLKKNIASWGSEEFIRLCPVRSSILVGGSLNYVDFDLEDISRDSMWVSEEGPTADSEILSKLHEIVDQSFHFIKKLDSYSTLNDSRLSDSKG